MRFFAERTNEAIYFVIVFCYHIGKRKADVVVR